MTIKPKPSPADKRRKFIETLTKTANVSRAALSAKIATSTAYRWRVTNEAFRVAWDDAINAALDDLETALLDRAVKGVDKPIMFRGEKVATVTTYSDALAMFLLRARRPQIYARMLPTTGPEMGSGMIDHQVELLEVERRLDMIVARSKPVG